MQPVIDRLGTIPVLARRVHTVAKLSALTESGGVQQAAPAAFVLPLGLRGKEADAATGLYRQSLDRLIGVVLIVRNVGDATGARALTELEPLIDAVVRLLVGWGPDGAFGVFVFVSGELVSIAGGTIIYQLDFAIEDQLRIARP